MRRAGGLALLITALGVGTSLAPIGDESGRALAQVATPIAKIVEASSRVPDVRTEATAPRLQPRRAPFVLEAEGATPAIVVYPPRDESRARPVAVMLHGMCSTPESTCAPIAGAVTRDHWLVCPRGTVACEGGGATWSMKDAPAQIEASVRRLATREAVDIDAPRTLLGFSFGATIAVLVAQHVSAARSDAQERGAWTSVVLLGAEVYPDAAALRRAGVRRVLLGAGDYDMMKNHMLAATDRLRRQGTDAVFVGLGPVGHTFPSDIDAWMARALVWTTT